MQLVSQHPGVRDIARAVVSTISSFQKQARYNEPHVYTLEKSEIKYWQFDRSDAGGVCKGMGHACIERGLCAIYKQCYEEIHA